MLRSKAQRDIAGATLCGDLPKKGGRIGIEEAQACAAHLRMEIKTKIGSSCVINVVEPETLARSSGKLKRIYDLRDKG